MDGGLRVRYAILYARFVYVLKSIYVTKLIVARYDEICVIMITHVCMIT